VAKPTEALPFLSPADIANGMAVWGFCERYLVKRYDDPKPVPLVHKEWWALCMSAHSQVAIAAPRNHAKSTCITFAYVLFILLERHSQHLLLLGSNESLTSGFLNELKAELNDNEQLRADYGLSRFIKETETELIVELTGGHRFRVVAKGAGQRMRGLKWERKRPDHVVFDDMEDDELVETEQRREKFRRWFYGTVKPILRVNGKIRGVGTIICFDSLLDRLMPSEKHADTVKEALRVYSLNTSGWVSVKYRAHNEDFSQVLWPEQRGAEELKRIRAGYASAGQLGAYGQEYLNDPIDAGTAYFRQQDFLPMRPMDFETRKTYYSAADLAIGETERNAYTAIIAGGLDSQGCLHIVDVRRERLDGEQIVDEMFSVHKRWEPEMFRLESENIAKAIGPFLNRKQIETGTYINIDSKAPTKDKDKRGRSIQARMRAGQVRFNKDAEWYPDLEEELLKYPKFPYKDQFDAMAWLGLMLEEMVEPPTDEDLEAEERDDAFADFSGQGCNRTTGY
jgi:predicted phage terminase large subunit-like protein